LNSLQRIAKPGKCPGWRSTLDAPHRHVRSKRTPLDWKPQVSKTGLDTVLQQFERWNRFTSSPHGVGSSERRESAQALDHERVPPRFADCPLETLLDIGQEVGFHVSEEFQREMQEFGINPTYREIPHPQCLRCTPHISTYASRKVHRYEDKDRQRWKATDEGVFEIEGVYKPMIDRKTFDKAQKRLWSRAAKAMEALKIAPRLMEHILTQRKPEVLATNLRDWLNAAKKGG